MKKVLSLVLVLALVLGTFSFAFAADTPDYTEAGNILKELGVLQGDGSDLMLDKELKRQDMIVLVSRLMGKEDVAKNFPFAPTFTDIEDPFYAPYIAWAQAEGLVEGMGDGTFGFNQYITAQQLQTLLLRVLGYVEEAKDWDNIPAKAQEVGIMTDLAVENSAYISRGLMAAMTVNTLKATVKGEGKTLAAKLNLELPKEIVSLAAVEVTVKVGEAANLPATITATYDDGSTAEVAVTWAAVDTSKVGTVTVEGTVEGTEIKAVATITVEAADLVVESISATNYKEVVITFNNELNEETVIDDNFDTGNINDTVALNEDKKSVTITLENALNPYDPFSVDITNVEDIYGNVVADTTMEIEYVFDTTKPQVVSVEAVGNSKIEVTYSEPVKTHGITNYYLNGKLFAGSVTVDGRVATLNLTKRLESGVYTLTVRDDKIQDYANFYVPLTKVDFVVEDDSVAPTAKLVSASQTEVVIEFSEPVVSIGNVTSADGTVTTQGLETDNVTYKIQFDRNNALPINGTTITFEDVEDEFGNVAEEIEIVINKVTIDIERPEVVDVTVDGQDKIIVEFSEDIVLGLNETFTLVDSDETETSLVAAYAQDDDGNDILTTVELTNGSTFEPGDYTLKIENVVDNTPLENKLLPFATTITVADVTKVEVSNIYVDTANNRILVKFSEKVDPATALDKANYLFIDAYNITNELANDVTLTLLEDETTVEIAFTDDDPAKDIDTQDASDVQVLQIKSVADLFGNVLTTVAYDDTWANWTTTLPAAPQVTDAKVVDVNTIVLDINGSIVEETIAPTDFVFTAGQTEISVIDAVYNEDDGTITLTVNADLDTDGTYGGTALTFALAAEVSTVDIFGQPLTENVATVADGVVPVATEITTEDNQVFSIALSEDITLDTSNNEYLVLVDGVLTQVTLSWDATNTAITFDLGAVQESGTVVNVKFFPTTGTANVDAANNALEAFDLSITVE